MKAILIDHFGGPDVLIYKTVSKPIPEKDFVTIHVKAFGLNHAEMHIRLGEWDEYNPISGIECVGLVDTCPSDEFPIGAKVAGIMDGMGRSRPGSYGEFVNVPVENVVKIESGLSWDQLAALPEAYSTAYSCLFTVLDVQPGEQILIRGATSTIGQAAVNLAVNFGVNVTATTRRAEKFDGLRKMGVKDTIHEKPQLAIKLENGPKFDKTLNLIGNSVLLDSISVTRAGNRMLQAGWLGGLAPVKDFNPMVQMESGVHFSLFHSKVLGSSEFPLSSIPLQEIAQKIEKEEWDASPKHVFRYDDIHSAHSLLDSHKAGGKIVIKH